jgi:hypothetical protein
MKIISTIDINANEKNYYCRKTNKVQGAPLVMAASFSQWDFCVCALVNPFDSDTEFRPFVRYMAARMVSCAACACIGHFSWSHLTQGPVAAGGVGHPQHPTQSPSSHAAESRRAAASTASSKQPLSCSSLPRHLTIHSHQLEARKESFAAAADTGRRSAHTHTEETPSLQITAEKPWRTTGRPCLLSRRWEFFWIFAIIDRY